MDDSHYYLQLWGDNYPYQTIRDSLNRELPILVMSAPIYAHDISLQDMFWSAKQKGHLCIGIMSCGYWPHYNEDDAQWNSRLAEIKTPHMQRIINAMDGWLSCERAMTFKNSILYSESDQADIVHGRTIRPWKERQIDIVFYGGAEYTPYYNYHKQIDLGIDCLRSILQSGTSCNRAVYIGHPIAEDGIEIQTKMKWCDWLTYLENCKILLVPSISDASPRIITDALTRGCAILVNSEIFGGWKYVAPETGAFFSSANDVVDAFNYVMNNGESGILDPSNWYAARWGKKVSALRLGEFCKGLMMQKANGA
jgi:hypothetical protein